MRNANLEITGKKVCVIGGACSIGVSFINAVQRFEPVSEEVDLNRAVLHGILPYRWPMNSYLSLEVSGPRPLRAAMVAFGGRGATNKT